MKDNIKSKNQNGDIYYKSIVRKNTAIDELKKIMETGDYSGAIELLKKQEDFIGTYHPLYPDFSIGFKKVGNKTVPFSNPISTVAHERYPQAIKGKFKLNQKYSTFNSIEEIFQHSYNTQTDIDIDMVEIRKMIGNDVDPFQEELDVLLGQQNAKWKIKHLEFPSAKPYKFCFQDSNYALDYILLRTAKIEGNKIFLNNSEQKSDIEVQLIIDLSMKSFNISLTISKDCIYNYDSMIKYLSFYKNVNSNKRLEVISLENDLQLVSGVIEKASYDSCFGTVEKEIEFIQNIIEIENRFNKRIIIPDIITKNDYNNVLYLGKCIRKGKIEGEWESIRIPFSINGESIKTLREQIDETFVKLKIEEDKVIKIFDDEFIIPKVITTLEETKFKDFLKYKEKIQVLEIGDIINIELVSGENKKYTEEYFFDID